VAEIQPYKVILQGAGREIALTYSDRERPAAKAAAGGAAKAVAGKGRKPPAAAAKSKPSRPAKPSPRGKEAP
jgi:hypothetical protein